MLSDFFRDASGVNREIYFCHNRGLSSGLTVHHTNQFAI